VSAVTYNVMPVIVGLLAGEASYIVLAVGNRNETAVHPIQAN